MAPARLSCLDPICTRLVKRTSGDMIISGRVYVFGNDLLDEDLCVLPLAPTTPALTVGNPVRVRLRWRPPPNLQPRSSRPHPRSQAQWYFVVANRHPKPKEAASIPALTSTSTADDRISSSPYAIQVYLRIGSSRTPPRPPPVHAAALAGFGAYVTFHRIPPFIAARCPSCSRRCTHPVLRLGDGRHDVPIHPSIRPRVLSPESSRDLCPARGDAPCARRAPTHPPSEAIESLPRFEKIRSLSRAGLSVDPCFARGARLPQLVAGYCRRRRVLACVQGRDVDASLLIARYPPSSIFMLFLPPNVARTTRERLLLLFRSSAQQEDSSHPKRRSSVQGGAERSNRWPQVHKQLSLGLGYTNRPTVFSPPSVHLIYTAQGTGAHLLQSCLPDFSLPISSHPAARCRIWIMIPRSAFEATWGRGGAPALRRGRRAAARSGGHCRLISTPMACSPVRRIRPSHILTARCGVRGGAFALQLGDVHAAAQVFGTPQAGYRHADRRAYPYIHPIPSHRPHLGRTQLGFHDAVFVLLEQRTPCALSAYPPPVSSLRGHGVPRRVADALFWRCAAAAAGDRAA
ncbi:hypothetical protein B0H14DRAFT_3613812 [Mycena olivaceomarginata]|nr:hypothetical protein B0H14DRAFT_3613812 [Mycena olivaceomarginata]